MARTLREAVRVNDHEAAGHAAFSLGYTRFLAGRYRDAARWFEEAELHFEREDTFGTLIHVRALRVGVDVFTGDVAGDAASLARLRATLGRPRAALQPGGLRRARRGLGGARAQRRRRARSGCCAARATLADMPGYAAQLAYEALRAGAPAGRAQLRAARARAATPASSPRTPRTRRRSPRATGPRCWRWPRRWPRSARCATRWRPRPTRRGVRARPGARTRRAARPPARASCTRPGQGAEPPVIDGLDGDAAALTAREAQLVALARRGLSNAEIADQLVLSVRTVETHLYRAMHKLGVNDRRDL